MKTIKTILLALQHKKTKLFISKINDGRTYHTKNIEKACMSKYYMCDSPYEWWHKDYILVSVLETKSYLLVKKS